MLTNGLSPSRILVIALKHIGDVIVATPALRALKERWPQAEIELLVSTGMGELVRGLPTVSVLHEVDRAALRGRSLAEWAFVRTLRARRYDIAVDLTGGERSAWYAFLSGAKVRVGADDPKGFPGRRLLFHAVTAWGAGHYAQSFVDILAPLGITAAAGALEIAIDPAAAAAVQPLLTRAPRPRAVVHPVSRWMFKSWPAASCAQTISGLLQRKLSVILTAGPAAAEKERAAEILALLPAAEKERVVVASGTLTLMQLAALIQNADIFLGVDSAPMHIASATNKKTVALFGPSGEHNWGPWKNINTVLSADKGCRPCGKDGCEGSKKSECLEMITAAQILSAVDKTINRQ